MFEQSVRSTAAKDGQISAESGSFKTAKTFELTPEIENPGTILRQADIPHGLLKNRLSPSVHQRDAAGRQAGSV